MPARQRYLIVDGHSIIFSWPELRKIHARKSSFARELLIKKLRSYQDWTGTRVIVVFDGAGAKVETTDDPHDIQIFYSRAGQSADSVIERLASKYANRFDLVVATSDYLEQQTVSASGAEYMSPEMLHAVVEETIDRASRRKI